MLLNADPYFHQGRELNYVNAQPVFYGPGWNAANVLTLVDTSTQKEEAALTSALSYLVQSPYMDMLQQVNSEAGTAPPPPPDRSFWDFFEPVSIPVSSTPRSPIAHGQMTNGWSMTTAQSFPSATTTVKNASTLTAVRYPAISDAQIMAGLKQGITSGALHAPDSGPNTHDMLYFVFTQLNTPVVRGDGSSSLQDFDGYHGSFQVNGKWAFYAVIVDTGNFDAETKAMSHELAEAVTNPNGGGYFSDPRVNPYQPGAGPQTQEIGDLAEAGFNNGVDQRSVLGPNHYVVQDVVDTHGRVITPTGSTPYQGPALDLTADAPSAAALPPAPAPGQAVPTNTGPVVLDFVNHNVYQYDGSAWKSIASNAGQIGVDSSGALFVLNMVDHQVYHYDGVSLQAVGNNVGQIGVDAAGALYALNMVDHQVYQHYLGQGWSWQAVGNNVGQIGVDADGALYALNMVDHQVYHHNLGQGWSWQAVGNNVAQIGVDASGALYAVNSVDHQVYQHQLGQGWMWHIIGSNARSISVNAMGSLGKVNLDGSQWRYNGSAWVASS